MSHARWTIQLHGRVHRVELEQGFWPGKRTIMLDGQRIFSGRRQPQKEVVHEFTVDGHACVVLIDETAPAAGNATRSTGYSLTVDGRVALGERVSAAKIARSPLLAFAALIPLLLVVGASLLLFIPSPIPQYSELQPVITRITEKTIDNSSKFTGALVLTLADPQVSLKYGAADAHSQQVMAALQKDDAVIVWVAKDAYQQGGTATVWQLQRGERQVVFYPDQVEVKTIWNRFWQAAGLLIILGGLFLLWQIARPLWLSRPSADLRAGANDAIRYPPVALPGWRGAVRRWAAVSRVVLSILGTLAACGLLWWMASQTYRAIELGADSLAIFVPLVQGILMSLPTIIAFDRLSRHSQFYDWTIWLSGVVALLLGAFETSFYLPTSYLLPYLNDDLVRVVAPLLLLFSGPSAFILLLAIAVALPFSSYLKCLAITVVWLASVGDAAFLANVAPLSPARSIVFASCIGLVAWSAIVALRLVVLANGPAATAESGRLSISLDSNS